MSVAHFRYCCIAALFAIGASCSGAPSAPVPIAPTPVPPQPVIPPPPSTTSSSLASIVVENAKVIVHKRDYFGYEPRFQLREIGGKSGATIQNVFVSVPDGGGDNTGPGCWIDPLRVPPGGRLDTFYTDEGVYWLSYCAPSSGSTHAVPYLQISVSFTDDQGGAGSAGAIVSADLFVNAR